ncbi:hypothetical protein ACJX0J_021306, partial [Zea mays]
CITAMKISFVGEGPLFLIFFASNINQFDLFFASNINQFDLYSSLVDNLETETKHHFYLFPILCTVTFAHALRERLIN